MSKPAIKTAIQNELDRINNLLRITKRNLSAVGQLPEGTLVCLQEKHRKLRYYRQTIVNGTAKRKSIGGPEEKLVQDYKKYKFYTIRYKILMHNKKVLERALKALKDYSAEAIHKQLPQSYRCLPDDCFLDDRLTELKDWAAKTYRRNTYSLPDNPNISCDGTEMRSKGETIIYDNMHYSGLAFQYDVYRTFRGHSGKIYGISPDFLIPCKDGSLLVWEHFGLLGNGQYSSDTLEKLNKYLDCGFVIGDNLIVTSDNSSGNTNELAILDALEKVKRRVQ